ncbi:MAG: flagellar basal body rod protein FlgB [Spirochaetes bacterium]|nr:flagellar basal body rod protein FlgB [Spirochaetota bacterium]
MELNNKGYSYRIIQMSKMYLSALNKRLNVIADNIANVDTPGFKRSEITFEAQLKRAIERENYQGFQAKVSRQRHIPFVIPIKWEEVQAKRVVDYSTTMRNDGNNVDIEKEMTDLSKNNLVFQTVMELLKNNYNLINLSLK